MCSSDLPASDAPLTIAQQAAEIEEDSDALLEELEDDLDDDFDLGGFRERRMEELRVQCVLSRRRKAGADASGCTGCRRLSSFGRVTTAS